MSLLKIFSFYFPGINSCHLPKATGECYGHYIRYYYDPVQEKCITFYWTGCVGNGNRFLDLEHCNATCFGITGKYILGVLFVRNVYLHSESHV